MRRMLKKILALTMIQVLLLSQVAGAYPVDINWSGTNNVARLLGIYLSDGNLSDSMSVTGAEVKAGVLDASNNIVTAPDVNTTYPQIAWNPEEYTGIDQSGVNLQPTFQIKFTINIIGKSTAYYNYSVNKNLVSLIEVDSGEVVASTVAMNNLINNSLFITPINKLKPNTSYKIKVDSGIITGNGTYGYPQTGYAYAGIFKTKGITPVWATDAVLSVNNLDQTSLTLNWPASANPDVTTFEVFQDGVSIANCSAAAPGYNVTGLTAGTAYAFTVKALDKDGNELGSLTANPTTLPPTPTAESTPPIWSNASLAASATSTTSVRLTWSGASDNVNVTGYKVLQDGVLLTDVIAGDATSYNVIGLSAGTSCNFKVEARDAAGNWSTDGPQVTGTTYYTLGTTATLTTGSSVGIEGGIAVNPVSLNVPAEGEANTVQVRDAAGEMLDIPNNHGMVEGSSLLRSAGGVYGFNLKGAGSGDTNHVKITMPYQLPTTRPVDLLGDGVLDDSKVAIYALTPASFGDFGYFQKWVMLPTEIDANNHTATIDVSGFDANGKDLILGVLYDSVAPTNFVINPWSRTATSISWEVLVSDMSPIKEVEIERVNLANPNDKKTDIVSFINNPTLISNMTDSFHSVYYTDNTPQPGVRYRYTVKAATDMLGNRGDMYSATAVGSLDSMDSLLKEVQDSIYQNLQQVQDGPWTARLGFAQGDSQNSVTQGFMLPTGGGQNMPFHAAKITWTSDRPDILTIPDVGPVQINRTLVSPEITEATVTLTGIISTRFYDRTVDPGTYGPEGPTAGLEIATGEVIVPLTIKFDIQPPTWPEGSNITVSNLSESKLDLDWPAATDNIGVVGYKLLMNGETVESWKGPNTHYGNLNVEPGTNYTFQVLAQDAQGNWSTNGLSTTVTTPDTHTPTWADGSSLTTSIVSGDGLTLNWSPAADNAGVTGYKIYKDGILLDTFSGDTITYNVTGLSEATQYTFKVEAGDATGNWSSSGPTVTVTTPDTQAPIWPVRKCLTASKITDSGLNLSWKKATDNVGVSSYRIYNNGVLIATVNGETTSYNVTGLEAKTKYVFTIEAGDAWGLWSNTSKPVVVTTRPALRTCGKVEKITNGMTTKRKHDRKRQDTESGHSEKGRDSED